MAQWAKNEAAKQADKKVRAAYLSAAQLLEDTMLSEAQVMRALWTRGEKEPIFEAAYWRLRSGK